MAAIYNSSDCDYCYSNETMGETHICVNGKSEYLGNPVDYIGLAEEDMECAVINGIESGELREEDAYESE